MSEERDSQLSAMFDDELPAGECELLARRLSRDEALRTQWSRYSLIGAALRSERGVALHDKVARRVQSVVAQEASYGESSLSTPPVGRPGGARRRAVFVRLTHARVST
jgi:negative regulator of sigma E activity